MFKKNLFDTSEKEYVEDHKRKGYFDENINFPLCRGTGGDF